jgi:hypothetical protein
MKKLLLTGGERYEIYYETKQASKETPANTIEEFARDLCQAQLDRVLKELKAEAMHISKPEGWDYIYKNTDWKHWGKVGYLCFIPEGE